MVEFYLGTLITRFSMKYSHGTPVQVRASIMMVLFFALPVYSVLSLFRQGDAIPYGFLLLLLFATFVSLRVFFLSLFEEYSVSDRGITRHLFGREKTAVNWQDVEMVRMFADGTTQIFRSNVVRPMHIYNNDSFKNEIRTQKSPEIMLVEYDQTPVD